MKIFRMSKKAKLFIIKHKDIKPRPLEKKIFDKIGEKVGYRTIYGFLKSEEFTHLSHNLSQVAQIKPKAGEKLVPKKQNNGKSFDFSIDTLRKLLDENPNHYWHDYVEYQVFGKDGKGGRLRSDLQKIFDFTRDVAK